MAKKRVRVFVEGRVQGVFFRAYMRDAARREGVNGWVRNLPDGRVEAILEGNAANVKKVVEWCHRGSPTSRVDKVMVIEEPYVGEFNDFSIKY